MFLAQKATATNRMHSNDLEACGMKLCCFWFHSDVKFLMCSLYSGERQWPTWASCFVWGYDLKHTLGIVLTYLLSLSSYHITQSFLAFVYDKSSVPAPFDKVQQKNTGQLFKLLVKIVCCSASLNKLDIWDLVDPMHPMPFPVPVSIQVIGW